MKRMISRLSASVFALGAALVLVSCASTANLDIPADLSPAKFFQTTQELVDKEQWDAASQYLNEFKKRYQDSQDVAIQDKLLEGEYLTAQILYKRGKLAEARDAYAALLQKYDGVPEKASSPPQWIRILCTKMIDTITKKLAPKPLVPGPGASPAPGSSPATDTAPASPPPAKS